MNCPHCSGKHKAGDKNCPEFRKYEEILAIQSNEKVSRQQAQVIYLRNNPNQGMNFAKAVTSTSTTTLANKFKSLDPNKAPSVDNSRNSKDKAATSVGGESVKEKAAQKPKPEMIEIICQSPKSGRTYKRMIEKPNTEDILDDAELTSENNPIVRSEAKRLFQEYDSDDMEGEPEGPPTKVNKRNPQKPTPK